MRALARHSSSSSSMGGDVAWLGERARRAFNEHQIEKNTLNH